MVCEPGLFEDIDEEGVGTFGARSYQAAAAAVGGRRRGGRTRRRGEGGGEEEEVAQEDEADEEEEGNEKLTLGRWGWWWRTPWYWWRHVCAVFVCDEGRTGMRDDTVFGIIFRRPKHTETQVSRLYCCQPCTYWWRELGCAGLCGG